MTDNTSPNKAPAVSVVIATFNYGRFLGCALDSVLAQTFQDFEVIVVDDGSTDDTCQVMRAYSDDARVSYLRREHQGQPRTKNLGIKAAAGRYIAFLDADDLWLPTKLEKQVAILEQDTIGAIGVVYSRRLWIDPKGKLIHRKERSPRRGDVLSAIFLRPFIAFSSSIVRRSTLDQIGLFDETTQYSIDYDLWLRIASHFHFDFVDEPLILYRTGHGNMSSRLDERILCVRKIIYRFLNEYGGKERLEPAVIRQALAEHLCDSAKAAGRGRFAYSTGAYLRALMLHPGCSAAWRALALDWWANPLKVFARKHLRQHAN